MLGVVLCGGQSSRMGADKALLKVEASTWAQTAIDKLAALHLQVVLSVNAFQQSSYAGQFNDCPLIADNKSLDIKGPLCGVLSVHLQYPTEDLLVLACDMPLMETVMLKELIAHFNQHPANNAFSFTNNNEPEPLCAIYKTTALSHILDLYHAGQLQKHSMKYMLEHASSFYIPLADDQKKYFRNFNAHADLNGL
jgi:molybdopterin-guanine dinucleotide biosynthesis protein A